MDTNNRVKRLKLPSSVTGTPSVRGLESQHSMAEKPSWFSVLKTGTLRIEGQEPYSAFMKGLNYQGSRARTRRVQWLEPPGFKG